MTSAAAPSAASTALTALAGRPKEHPRAEVYLDFEATDKKIDACIVQIGAFCPTYEECFLTKVKADRPMKAKAAEVTGIYDHMLKDAPPVKEALLSFLAWLDKVRPADDGRITLIAYNGMDYDFVILFNEMMRWNLNPARLLREHGVDLLFDAMLWTKQELPTHNLFRRPDGRPDYRLGKVYEALTGKKLEGAHDALVDAKAMAAICASRPDLIDCGLNDGFVCRPTADCVNEFKPKFEGLQKTQRKVAKRKLDGQPNLFDVLKRLKGKGAQEGQGEKGEKPVASPSE